MTDYVQKWVPHQSFIEPATHIELAVASGDMVSVLYDDQYGLHISL